MQGYNKDSSINSHDYSEIPYRNPPSAKKNTPKKQSALNSSFNSTRNNTPKHTQNRQNSELSSHNFQNQNINLSISNQSKNNKKLSNSNTNNLSTQKFAENFKVVIRVRPLMQREAINGIFVSAVDVSPDHRIINIYEYFNLELVSPNEVESYIEDPENYQTHQFCFDFVYDENSSQEELYRITAKNAVLSS